MMTCRRQLHDIVLEASASTRELKKLEDQEQELVGKQRHRALVVQRSNHRHGVDGLLHVVRRMLDTRRSPLHLFAKQVPSHDE